MMRTATFAAVVAVFAAVLSATPMAVAEAQPSTMFCSDSPVWRFYTSTRTSVYDFEARTNVGTVGLIVYQYDGGSWRTRLTSQAFDSQQGWNSYNTGSVVLRARQWTDVRVFCSGAAVEDTVTLTVTRREPVRFIDGGTSPFLVRCDAISVSKEFTNLRDGVHHDIVMYKTGGGRDGDDYSLGAAIYDHDHDYFIINEAVTDASGSLYATIPLLRVNRFQLLFDCVGGTSPAVVSVTRRESVSLGARRGR